MSLQGKVVLITGASNGIGKACAQHLSSQGASVVVNYHTDSASATALVQQINANGGSSDRAIAVQADVSTLAGIDKLVGAAVEKFGRLDVVVANAASMAMRTVEDTSEEDFDRAFGMNVKGPYFLVQKSIPHMAPGSRVILLSTGVNSNSAVLPPYLLYAATKGAVDQMTRLLAKGLAPRGILVNAVAPGPTGTDLFFRGKPDAMVEGIRRASPFERLGEPGEVAGVVGFLAGGEGSSWVSGQILGVNGAAFV